MKNATVGASTFDIFHKMCVHVAFKWCTIDHLTSVELRSRSIIVLMCSFFLALAFLLMLKLFSFYVMKTQWNVTGIRSKLQFTFQKTRVYFCSSLYKFQRSLHRPQKCHEMVCVHF